MSVHLLPVWNSAANEAVLVLSVICNETGKNFESVVINGIVKTTMVWNELVESISLWFLVLFFTEKTLKS